MVEHFGTTLYPLATYTGTIGTHTIPPPLAMTLNLGAIYPLYGSAEFEFFYTKHLAENMTNEKWFDINLWERMWISRFFAFNYLHEYAVFAEWHYTPFFNATVEAKQQIQDYEKRIAQSYQVMTAPVVMAPVTMAPVMTAPVITDPVITRARSLSEILKPDLAELSNGFLPEQSNKLASPETTPQIRPQVPLRKNSMSYCRVRPSNDALYISIPAAEVSTFAGHEGRNCSFWAKELLGISEISVVSQVEPQQGMCKVAIISSKSWGRGSRERVRHLVNEFCVKSQAGDLGGCEWLKAVAATSLGTGRDEKLKMETADNGKMKLEVEEKKIGNGSNDGNDGGVGWGGDGLCSVVVDKRNKRRRKRGSCSTTEVLLAGSEGAHSLEQMLRWDSYHYFMS